MKTNNMQMEKLNPMVIFWLGVLTGALVVGLAFLYKGVNPRDGGAALYGGYSSYSTPYYYSYSAPSTNYAMPVPPIGS